MAVKNFFSIGNQGYYCLRIFYGGQEGFRHCRGCNQNDVTDWLLRLDAIGLGLRIIWTTDYCCATSWAWWNGAWWNGAWWNGAWIMHGLGSVDIGMFLSHSRVGSSRPAKACMAH